MGKHSQTVLKLGPITLQMKGSGDKKGTSYHSMQFNASLSDILKYSAPTLGVISGNCEKVVAGILKAEGC